MPSIVKTKLYRLIPKSLLWRFVLIIIVPVLIAQLLSVYLFYQRHWYNVTSSHGEIIATEIIELIQQLEKSSENKKNGRFLNLNYEVLGTDKLPKQQKSALPEEVIIFQRNIKELINNRTVLLAHNDNNNDIVMYTKLSSDKIVRIHLPYKSITNPTAHLFVMWVIFLTVTLLCVSLIFSRRQIASITNLTNALNKFGHGEKNIKYMPYGAQEIRLAGLSFLKMKDRIERYNSKRTKLLAMISHDLRTPLTRMKLQVSMMDEHLEEKNGLNSDIVSMQNIIDSYLDFTKCETEQENLERADAAELVINHIQANWQQNNIEIITSKEPLYANISYYSFLRAISNIINNSVKYASLIKITISSDNNYAIFTIEDNGDGIKKEEREKVFKPFYRSDHSRSLDNSSSVGLGLAITKEVIKRHKGLITLGDSKKLKGLMVTIKIPKIK
ncbi:MAG: hypothetical protein DGJ47_000229 [Rickettsiaceae bacterium]